jgi:hypothetical protein
MALACDMRIAGDKAVLGLPETSLAIIPGSCGGLARFGPCSSPTSAGQGLVVLSACLAPLEFRARRNWLSQQKRSARTEPSRSDW